jgi:hypothetical protein
MPHYYTYDSNLRDRNKFTSTVETTFGTRRYFSSLDTEVYFGAQQVDEIVAIDFAISEPKLPIYGYNSFYPNRVVNGRRTVQGTFAINFTHTMYLLNILNSIDDSIFANDYEALVYYCPEEDTTGLGIGNSAIFNKRFDITISYGYAKTEGMQTYNSCYQTLVGVQIVDYRQALDTEGNPILDMYSFIAKDIRYQEASSEPGDEIAPAPGPEDGINKCHVCQQEPCVCNNSLPDYIIRNGQIQGELNEYNTQTSNPEVAGFLIEPMFYKDSNDNYYVSLCINTANNNTKIFKNVDMTLTSKSLGINLSINFKELKVGITKAQVMGGSLRDSAVKIMKELERTGERYGPVIFDVSFTAEHDGKEFPVSMDHPTYLIKK